MLILHASALTGRKATEQNRTEQNRFRRESSYIFREGFITAQRQAQPSPARDGKKLRDIFIVRDGGGTEEGFGRDSGVLISGGIRES